MFHSKNHTTMKSIYKYIFAVLALGLSITSCSTDSLDIEQQGVTTTDKYKTANDTQVLQFIAAVYAEIQGDSYQAVLSGGPASYLTVNYEMSRMSAESANYYTYSEAADAGTYSYIWSYYYRTAYWCNMIITNLPDNNVATTSVKNQVIAEARALRAIAMMNLVQLYGNPPLADHILTGSEGNTPAADSWAFIESELAAAAEALPSKSSISGQSSIGGRMTREAAYAYLGKAYLWEGKYNEAASTLYNKVIATGLYALVPDFATLNSSANDFSSENLWEFDFSGETSASTSQEGCFDLACFSAGVPVWYTKYASITMAFGMSAYPSTSFASFMGTHDGKTSQRYKETLMDYGTAAATGYVTLPIQSCEGYIKVKGLCLAADLVGAFPYFYTTRNTVYMRYAEVLLNYAEAVAKGGTAGALSGLDALNKVRERAGLTDAPSLDMDNATYGVKAERRAELYGEGQHFIDLVRWGDAAKELADCGKTSSSFNSVNADGTYNISKAVTGGNGFKSGKNELFPIPSTDINSNPNLKQNTGW
jgi:hypothetical protein